MQKLHVIGCGGGGGWVIQALSRMADPEKHSIVLWDGDLVEEKNLDRQLFDASTVGHYKSDVWATKLETAFKGKCESRTEYLTFAGHVDQFEEDDCIFLCVDNHAARKNALMIADAKECRVFNAANEYTDCEAWYYEPGMKDTPCDPRVRSPELLTDHTGDPLSPCTGLAQEESPQLALANMGAAFMAVHLWYLHTTVACEKGLSNPEFMRDVPIYHGANFARMRSLSPRAFNEAEVKSA